MLCLVLWGTVLGIGSSMHCCFLTYACLVGLGEGVRFFGDETLIFAPQCFCMLEHLQPNTLGNTFLTVPIKSNLMFCLRYSSGLCSFFPPCKDVMMFGLQHLIVWRGGKFVVLSFHEPSLGTQNTF